MYAIGQSNITLEESTVGPNSEVRSSDVYMHSQY